MVPDERSRQWAGQPEVVAEGRTCSAQGGMEMGAFDRQRCLAVCASSVMSVGDGEVNLDVLHGDVDPRELCMDGSAKVCMDARERVSLWLLCVWARRERSSLQALVTQWPVRAGTPLGRLARCLVAVRSPS